MSRLWIIQIIRDTIGRGVREQRHQKSHEGRKGLANVSRDILLIFERGQKKCYVLFEWHHRSIKFKINENFIPLVKTRIEA